MKTSLVERLRLELNSKLEFEVGTVVRFEINVYENGRNQKRNFAAIFTSENLWHLTGKNYKHGDKLTTEVFLKSLREAKIENVQLATDWATV